MFQHQSVFFNCNFCCLLYFEKLYAFNAYSYFVVFAFFWFAKKIPILFFEFFKTVKLQKFELQLNKILTNWNSISDTFDPENRAYK